MKQIIFLLIVLSHLGWTQTKTLGELAGGAVEIAKCPSVADEYGRLLVKIDALRASIKKDGNCQDVSDRLKAVQKLTLDRDHFLSLITKAGDQPLNEKELAEVSKYVENVTQKVGNLVELISTSGTCFDSDGDRQTLTLLSGLIGESASLLGQVAGPWGAPIALGGQIVAGFITGLDKVMKNRAGYDFSDRNQWSAYVQNVCTYQSLRGEIDALIHPSDRLQTLKEVQRKLDVNYSVLLGQCSECGTVKSIQFQMAQKDPLIRDLDAKYPNRRLGLLSARIQLARDWVAREIDRVQAESSSYWNNVTGKALLSTAQRDMEGFLIDFEAPKFITYQTIRAQSLSQELNNFLAGDGIRVLTRASQQSLFKMESLKFDRSNWFEPPIYAPVYKALVETNWRQSYKSLGRSEDELQASLLSIADRARSDFEQTAWAFGTAYAFCDFFRQTNLYVANVQSVCSSRVYQSTKGKIVAFNGKILSQWDQPTKNVEGATWLDALNQWSDQVSAQLNNYKLQ